MIVSSSTESRNLCRKIGKNKGFSEIKLNLMNSAAEPVPAEDLQGDGRWISMHERFVEETKTCEPDVLLIGDSLIHNLMYTELWSRSFVPLHPLNFGIGGDQTQHVLWRTLNGELENIRPKTLLPRGQKPNKLRERNANVNELFSTALTGEQGVQVLNICKDIVQSDGTISALDMDDYLHLTSSGYAKVFAPLLDLLGQLLTEGEEERELEEEGDLSESESALTSAPH
ncbi:hypothetical protein B566_EDAN010305 [Ephemera danica]|nr:hypothetical protein B566_EDAN010305 [Ephemera danica]